MPIPTVIASFTNNPPQHFQRSFGAVTGDVATVAVGKILQPTGLAFDTSNGTLYMAAHHGVSKLKSDGNHSTHTQIFLFFATLPIKI